MRRFILKHSTEKEMTAIIYEKYVKKENNDNKLQQQLLSTHVGPTSLSTLSVDKTLLKQQKKVV